jgi:hypothetical protein
MCAPLTVGPAGCRRYLRDGWAVAWRRPRWRWERLCFAGSCDLPTGKSPAGEVKRWWWGKEAGSDRQTGLGLVCPRHSCSHLFLPRSFSLFDVGTDLALERCESPQHCQDDKLLDAVPRARSLRWTLGRGPRCVPPAPTLRMPSRVLLNSPMRGTVARTVTRTRPRGSWASCLWRRHAGGMRQRRCGFSPGALTSMSATR